MFTKLRSQLYSGPNSTLNFKKIGQFVSYLLALAAIIAPIIKPFRQTISSRESFDPWGKAVGVDLKSCSDALKLISVFIGFTVYSSMRTVLGFTGIIIVNKTLLITYLILTVLQLSISLMMIVKGAIFVQSIYLDVAAVVAVSILLYMLYGTKKEKNECTCKKEGTASV